MFCPVCGANNNEMAQFCNQCGTSLAGSRRVEYHSPQLMQRPQSQLSPNPLQSLQPQQQRQQPHPHMQQLTMREPHSIRISHVRDKQSSTNDVLGVPQQLLVFVAFVMALSALVFSWASLLDLATFKSTIKDIALLSGSSLNSIAKSFLF